MSTEERVSEASSTSNCCPVAGRRPPYVQLSNSDRHLRPRHCIICCSHAVVQACGVRQALWSAGGARHLHQAVLMLPVHVVVHPALRFGHMTTHSALPLFSPPGQLLLRLHLVAAQPPAPQRTVNG